MDVLGLPLNTALSRLEAEGKPVRTVEVRSKKGSKGDDRRVVKVTETDGETLVYWSAFLTEVAPKAPEGYLNVPVLCESGGSWRVEVRTLSLSDPAYDFSDPRKVLSREAGNYVYLTSISHLRLARSRDGIHFTVDPEPFIRPDCALEGFGAEDARITLLDGTYWINYTAVSAHGITTALAATRDFVEVRKHGVAFVTENRDVTIFPEKIRGKYFALVRPVPRQIGAARIWLAESPDLLHWGSFCPLGLPVFPWSDARTGGGAVPLRIPQG